MKQKKNKGGFLRKLIIFVIVFSILNVVRENREEKRTDTYQTGTQQGEMQNEKEEQQEEKHLLLKSRGDGSCAFLRGDVLLNVVFVNDSESVWTENDKQEVRNGHIEAAKLTKADAQKYGVNINMQIEYREANVSGTFSVKDYTEWAEKALKSAGFKDKKSVNIALEKKYKVDEAPILLYVNRPGRSFAVRYSGSEGVEYAIFYRDAIDFRHELYHLFGAEDFYYPEQIKLIAKKYFQNSIMLTSENAVVDDLTAYLLGWTDTLSETANNFLEETKNITKEEIEAANDNEWFTGEGTKRIGDATYTGQILEGEAVGKGKMVWDSGVVYEGEWLSNQPHGQGTMTWNDGATYTGDFVKGIRQGKGTIRWSDGSVYVGEFENNERHGQGTLTWASGTYYTGEWQHGKQHGQGTLVFESGTVQSGTWNQGEFVQ